MQVEMGRKESLMAGGGEPGEALWGSLSVLIVSGPVRTSCLSLYWHRYFPLPLWTECWRPGVCQKDCRLHLTTLQAPDWLPFRLLSPGFPLCESLATTQRAGPVTCIPWALFLSPGLRDAL